MYGIDKVCIDIVTSIASHPLVLANLIQNPLTGERVPITNYRLYGGIDLDNNSLTCAVYPSPVTSDVARSATNQVASIIYKPFNLGDKHDDVAYMINVSFYYNSVTSGSKSTPLIIKNVPTQLAYDDDEILIENPKDLNIYTDVALHILSQASELLRLIIYDLQNTKSRVEVLRTSFIGGEWEKSPYFKEAVTACIVTTNPPKAFKLTKNIKDININYENSRSSI